MEQKAETRAEGGEMRAKAESEEHGVESRKQRA